MLFEFTKTRIGKRKSFVHSDMDGVQFCLKALTKHKDERRMHCIRLYVKSGVMVGTDGSRLHKYEPETEMPDGFYRPLIKLKSEVVIYHEKDNKAEYPDFDDLLKIPEGVEPIKNLGFGEHHVFACYAKAVRALSEDAALRFDYVKDLGDEFFDLFVIPDEKTGMSQGCLFVNGKKTALIMGMRM